MGKCAQYIFQVEKNKLRNSTLCAAATVYTHIVHGMFVKCVCVCVCVCTKQLSARRPLKLLIAGNYEEWEATLTFPFQTVSIQFSFLK